MSRAATAEETARHLLGRMQRRLDADLALAGQARRVAELLALRLVHEFGATRVYLFGSLVRGDFTSGSDIDLAVAGLPDPAELWRIGSLLDEDAAPFTFDLVPLDRLPWAMQERICSGGARLA